MTYYIPTDEISRETYRIICPTCMSQGAMETMDTTKATKEEIDNQSCGRNYECCVRVFLCTFDKSHRLVIELPAPEVSW